ncbi:hypothetical protein WIW50_07215 [Flavobacteriaceae bacterium 3-367]
MDFENMNLWCWAIPLLVGVLCAYFGFLIGKSGTQTTDDPANLKLLQDKNAKLEAELAACNKKLTSSSDSTPVASMAPSGTTAAKGPVFNAAAAKSAMGFKIKQDDLTIVEGIGPKIEGLFHNHDIKTWKALSETTVAKCRDVLNSGGNRYKMHDPASWPMQGKMCYEGKWKDLAKWQDKHKHGKL